MTGLEGRLCLAVVVVAGLLAACVGTANADDVRPVQVLVRELPSGDFQVQWSVPKQMPVGSMPSPLLPPGSSPVEERTLIERPSSWVMRQTYRCPDGLAGRSIGVDYPFYNLGFSTILRVELLSGECYTHMLDPGTDAWTVPEGIRGGLVRHLREVRDALVDGVRHVFHRWAHGVLLLAIALLGSLRGTLRLVSAFFVAQVVGAVVGSLLDIGLDAPLAETGAALASVVLAAQVLRPPGARTQLAALAAGAGVIHGLGIARGGADLPSMLSFVLGMDAVLVIAGVLATVLGVRLVRGTRRIGIARAAAYALGGLGFALAIHAVVGGPTAAAQESRRRLRLPSLVAEAGGAALPGSRRLASSAPDAALQAYVAVEAFEVRCEILVRLAGVAALVGADAGPELAVEDQAEVARRVRQLVFERVSLTIDGARREPSGERIDFMTLDSRGALPRPAPVAERVDTTWVGVSASFATPTTAQDVKLVWTFSDALASVPATVIDPESTRSVLLTPEAPVLAWTNELTEDPVPEVSPVAVEPVRITLPLASLLLLVAAVLAAVLLLRRRLPMVAFSSSRLLVALALLAGPFGLVAFAAPGSDATTPPSGEARRILVRLLLNVYRALEYREESAVFDRLAVSVEGDALSEVYLQQRRGLEMEKRGGAQSRVEAVEVLEVSDVEPVEGGGFAARAAWTVAGTVTHFGHRHFRQNRYDAIVTLVPLEGVWKIRSLEVLDEQRLR